MSEHKIEELEGKIDDLHDAIVGAKLTPGTGLMGRIIILEKNIEFLSMKFSELENRIKLEKESTKVKLGIIWYLAGTVTSGIILYLINVALKVK